LASTRQLGRKIWKKWSGYHRRGLVETKMRCFKLLGERVMARAFDRQVAELQIRAAILNRFTRLGAPMTVAVTMPQFRLGFGVLRTSLIYATKPRTIVFKSP
jgi:chromosome condensin MukBEF MukE localization factor